MLVIRQSPSVKNGKSLIGWDEFVSYNRQEAILWHKVWKDSGKANTGFIKDMRNNSRYAYHYELKYVRNNNKVIQSVKLFFLFLFLFVQYK